MFDENQSYLMIDEDARQFLVEVLQEAQHAQKEWENAFIIDEYDYRRAMDILGEEI